MKYYKLDSIPLEEVELGIGERAIDEYGNYVEGSAIGDGTVILQSVLNDWEKVNKCENEAKFLKAFWALTNKKLKANDIQFTNI